MPRGKSPKPVAGQRVRVLDGATMPEFDQLPIGGWTGTVVETSGSGAKLKIILEWDAAALAQLPEHYRQHCEASYLDAAMACLPGAEVAVVDE